MKQQLNPELTQELTQEIVNDLVKEYLKLNSITVLPAGKKSIKLQNK
tara:strand:+ start:5229 stop:5369 length:141 start_codon:yes stop_codon:yes gene_type:complete